MNRKILALAVCIMTIPVFATAQSVYKWTDENGVTQYGDRAPTGKESESVSIRTGKAGKKSSANSESPQQKVEQMTEQEAQNQDSRNMDAKEQARQKQRAANCNTARSNLALIRTGSRIKVQENGEERYLTPEEIQEKREQFEAIAELNCDDDNGS